MQDFVHASVDAKLLFQDSYEHIHADRDPDLSLDRVLGCAIERFNVEMLLDPFEEKFDLPTRMIEFRDDQGVKMKIIGEEDEMFVRLRVEKSDAAQVSRIPWRGLHPAETNRLVASQSRCFVHRTRLNGTEDQVPPAAREKKGCGGCEAIEAPKVDIAAIEDIESPRFYGQEIQRGPVREFSMCYQDKTGDIGAQVEQGVKLDGALGAAEMRPREQIQTEIDHGRIERIGRLMQLDIEGIRCVQPSSARDQTLGKVRPNPPIALFIGIGQRAARHRSPKAHMVELRMDSPQARLDVAKTLAAGQLRESQAEVLIKASETAGMKIPAIASDTAMKFVHRHKVEKLSENESAGMHRDISSTESRGDIARKAFLC